MALSVATGLLGACLPGTGARIVALVGGPCSEGPGTVNSICLTPLFLELLVEMEGNFGLLTMNLLVRRKC